MKTQCAGEAPPLPQKEEEACGIKRMRKQACALQAYTLHSQARRGRRTSGKPNWTCDLQVATVLLSAARVYPL
ncbi:MAG: hypothetical protein LLG44_02795 [Chloroflexi bacterium]|nr:hypothetical protein [Chloroflexota bacterium]